jgi:hypothetical protein
LITETVTWHAVAEEMPDSGTTVLVRSRDPADSEPVWLGWYEDGSWFGVDATEFAKGAIVAWADVPRGPP